MKFCFNILKILESHTETEHCAGQLSRGLGPTAVEGTNLIKLFKKNSILHFQQFLSQKPKMIRQPYVNLLVPFEYSWGWVGWGIQTNI